MIVDIIQVLDDEIKRAEASATSTQSAFSHSLRDAAGKAKQHDTAQQAEARAEAMRQTRTKVVELVRVHKRLVEGCVAVCSALHDIEVQARDASSADSFSGTDPANLRRVFGRLGDALNEQQAALYRAACEP